MEEKYIYSQGNLRSIEEKRKNLLTILHSLRTVQTMDRNLGNLLDLDHSLEPIVGKVTKELRAVTEEADSYISKPYGLFEGYTEEDVLALLEERKSIISSSSDKPASGDNLKEFNSVFLYSMNEYLGREGFNSLTEDLATRDITMEQLSMKILDYYMDFSQTVTVYWQNYFIAANKSINKASNQSGVRFNFETNQFVIGRS